MKWIETLGIIVLFVGLLQGINWILKSIGLETMNGDTLTFLISVILVSLIIIVIILIEQNTEIREVKKRLKMKKEKGIIEKIIRFKGKKGQIDPKILFWILIVILLYLFLKSIGINIFG